MENPDNIIEIPTPEFELEENKPLKNKVKFHGKGSQLFAIDLMNTIFIILTLGLYYPWAKAKKLKYVYQNTSLADSRFDFLGTGKEIFRGFIKAVLILIVFYSILTAAQILLPHMKENEVLLAVFIVLLVLLIFVGIPFFSAYAIYGTFRYRSARSSWRGILCGFDANRKEFIATYLKAYYFILLTYAAFIGVYIALLLTMQSNGFDPSGNKTMSILSLSMLPIMILFIYAYSWYQTKLYKITYGNLRLGDLKLNFKGEVTNLFGIQLGGSFLSGLTLGIYYFWFKKDLYNFLIQNCWVEQDGVEYRAKSNITAGQVFNLEVGNFFLLIITLGLAYSWTYCRTANFITRNIIIPEEIDVDRIQQTEKAYTDATGEEMADMLDLGGIFF